MDCFEYSKEKFRMTGRSKRTLLGIEAQWGKS